MKNIGRKIYGYCNGYFGRDDYEDKIIIAEGYNWVVCKYFDSNFPVFSSFNNEEEKNKMILEWSVKD